jgi:hypothetical protein
MHAHKGDRIVIRGHRIGEPSRDCEVLEVRGNDGAPPYVVRWDDTGQVALYYPGVDAVIDELHDADRSRAS